MCLSNDGVEDTAHFMLLCHEYATHRSHLLDRVYIISVSYGVDIYDISEDDLLFLLLYGNEDFSDLSNKQILVASIEYIKATNRLT